MRAEEDMEERVWDGEYGANTGTHVCKWKNETC
jgi:hypothetical protein